MDKELTILVIDDDKFLLEMYKKKLEHHSVSVVLSSDSVDALAKLREGLVPDVIVLDIIMPGMDGLELLETIRKENLVPTSLVIMLTNESEAAQIKRAEALGVAGYLIKASNVPSEVAEKIMQIVHEHKPQ
jgi:CheY-like chemotaxis protein